VALTIVLIASHAGAAPWRQTFDHQLPGQTPHDWRLSWGDVGDDLLEVSNLRSLSGGNSLLLDRMSGEQATMAGWSTAFPQVAERWLAFSAAFLIQGHADAVRCGLELRGANPGERVLAVGIDGRAARLATPDGQSTAPLGEYVEDGWYRLRLWLPTLGGAQDHALGRLERRGADNVWQPVGALGRVPAKAPAGGYGTFMPVTWPGKRGYLLFLDELTAEAGDTP
jgi:hypothetical protein